MAYRNDYTDAEIAGAAQKLIATNSAYAKLTRDQVVVLANRGNKEIQRLLNKILETTGTPSA